jgi:alpha-1,2-mannosyltransferase
MRRALVAAFVGALGVIVLFVAMRALTVPPWIAAPLAIAAAVVGARALRRRLPAVFDELLGSKRRLVAWCVLAVLVVAQTARLSVFMLDSEHPEFAVVPEDAFYTNHSCFSAYHEAARLAPSVANVYDPAHVRTPLEGGKLKALKIGRFDVDLYEYPPPFLLPFYAAQRMGGDFFRLRALWFAVDLTIVALGLALLAWHIDGRAGAAAALLAPLVVFSPNVQHTLQVGNFQLAALALSVIAMIAFARGRHVLGGGLLAYVTLGKVFPGILLVVLLVQRRWRELASTAAWAALLVVATFALFGAAPFHAFLTFQLPRMSSGEAFPMLWRFPPAAAVNHSVFGLVIKLHHLGVSWATNSVAGAVAWLYTLVVVALAWAFARRRDLSLLESAQGWIALVWLAALRSPFTPNLYATFGTVWVLLLLFVERRRDVRTTVAFAAAWIVLLEYMPNLDTWRFVPLALLTVPPQALSYATLAIAMRRHAVV